MVAIRYVAVISCVATHAGVVGADPVDAPSLGGRPERAIVSVGGEVGLGASGHTTFFPEPGAASLVAVRGGPTTWALGPRLGLAPELAVSHGVRIGGRATWTALAGLRLTGRPDPRASSAAFVVARGGVDTAAHGVADLGVGVDLRWPGARWHMEFELGALVARVTSAAGDIGDVMATRTTYVSGHLGASFGRGF
ncbi:MAG: hypothetical protein R3B06_02820 [Kofleriaceae bacterium]